LIGLGPIFEPFGLITFPDAHGLTKIVPDDLGALHKGVFHVDVELYLVAIPANTETDLVLPVDNHAGEGVPPVLRHQNLELIVPQSLDVEN